MATSLEEIQKLLRNPGMTRTPAPGTIADGEGGQNRSLSFTGGVNANVRRPGIAGGVSSVGNAPVGARVGRNARVAQSGAQGSRLSTESKLNPEIGEALRLSLIEQQRVSGPRTGSMGAFERRDRREARTAAQTAVDSNLQALQGIRQAGVDERGLNLQATTALENRQMQEAGAFDRALLGMDEAMLKGQFGLAGIAAEGEARNPFAGALKELVRKNLNGELETSPELINALNVLGKLGVAQGTAEPGIDVTVDATGTTLTGPLGAFESPQAIQAEAEAKGLKGQELLNFYRDNGVAPTENGLQPVQQVDAETRAAREQARLEREERDRRRRELLSSLTAARNT